MGLDIERCFLIHINNQYVRQGGIDPQQLFTMADITDDVADIAGIVPYRIDDMLDIIVSDKCPEPGIGKHCSDPYECAISHCWEFLPEYNVTQLYYGGQKGFGLLDDGVLAITEIPDSFKLSDKQQIQKQCVESGQPHIDKAGINQFLATLRHPLSYLDFETFNPGVPMFDGTRPYQKIPFQWSLHVVRNENAEPEHHSFLVDGPQDPRPEFLGKLKESLQNEGSIITYSMAFEKGIMTDLGNAFPGYAGWVDEMTVRMVDLLIPFRDFLYHHPSQHGSASLKAVLPALTGKGYDGMAIDNGEEASLTFQRITYGDVTEEERRKVRDDLKEYCGLDTEGMIWIVNRLRTLA
jgi:hypothetical protein